MGKSHDDIRMAKLENELQVVDSVCCFSLQPPKPFSKLFAVFETFEIMRRDSLSTEKRLAEINLLKQS